MAKTSSIKKNQHRMQLVKRMAPKRARLKGVAEDRSLPPEERFAARLKLAEMPQLCRRAHSQPLPIERPAAWLLPQVPAVPDRASGPRVVRPDPRHGQVELVGERAA
jgi:hypothetical protein